MNWHANPRFFLSLSLPKGGKLESFRAEAEIIWKDLYFWEDWEEYQYGLTVVEIFNEDDLTLKRHLCGRSNLEEAAF